MPTCEVCQGEEYYEEDGQYYCRECNTQSQSMVVMEIDDSHRPTQLSFGALRRVGTVKKQQEKESVFVPGRPWSKYEAYQLILQSQAAALINRGAQPSVTDVVLRLWAKYLSQLGVAFTGETKACLVPKVFHASKPIWQREVFRGGAEKPEVNPKKMKRNLRRSDCIKSKMRQMQGEKFQEKESLAETLQGETFYEGDNPMEEGTARQESDDSDDSLLDYSFSDTSQDSSDEGVSKPKLIKGRQASHSTIQRMTLCKTLAFLYLGCVFTSRWITVSDLLRWVRAGSVPYLETSQLLLPDMKLSAFDPNLFLPIHVSPAMLRFEAGRLLQFLGFQKIPESPVKYICITMAISLDLPESFVPHVVQLLRRCPVDVRYKGAVEDCWFKSLPNIDALCAAYILVALKLLFGLNGCSERKLSLYTKAVQAEIGEEPVLFDWSQWQIHTSHKFLSGLEGENNVDAMCETFKEACLKEQNFSHSKLYTKRREKKVAAFEQENRGMLKRPANVLEERWRNREATAARLTDQAVTGQRPDTDQQDSQAQGSSSPRADEFRTCVLQHIFNPEEFLKSQLPGPRKVEEEEEEEGEELPAPDSVNASGRDASAEKPTAIGTMTTSVSLSPPAGDAGFRRSSSECSGSGSDLPREKVTASDGLSPQADNSDSRRSSSECSGSDSGSPSSTTSVSKRLSSSFPVATGPRCVKGENEELGEDPLESDTDVAAAPADQREAVISRLLGMLSGVDGRYVQYPRVLLIRLKEEDVVRRLREKQHGSYVWMLKVLSQRTLCPQTHIEKMVWEIEALMMGNNLVS